MSEREQIYRVEVSCPWGSTYEYCGSKEEAERIQKDREGWVPDDDPFNSVIEPIQFDLTPEGVAKLVAQEIRREE